MSVNLVVYTALFGDYDYLVEPDKKFSNCDFVCFTDQKNLHSKIWDIKLVTNADLPNNLMNRKYKLFPHKYLSKYQFSLYIDTNVFLKGNPISLVEKYLNDIGMAIPRHQSRSCIYDEAKECIILEKSSYKKTYLQMLKYKRLGFPHGYGMSENGIILRRHNDSAIINLMENWWVELSNETQRDQLSLPPLLWQNDLVINYMEESLRTKNEYFELIHHKMYQDSDSFYRVKIKIYFTIRRIFYYFLSF